MLLKVEKLVVRYSKNEAIRGSSLYLDEGEIISILGSNGAGKSTILRTISGLIRPASGEIHFNGRRIDGLSTRSIVQMGIAHVMEQRRLFPQMTVRENLNMGAYLRRQKQEVQEDIERMHAYFPIIKARSNQLAGTLSGGEQQMVAIARAPDGKAAAVASG